MKPEKKNIAPAKKIPNDIFIQTNRRLKSAFSASAIGRMRMAKKKNSTKNKHDLKLRAQFTLAQLTKKAFEIVAKKKGGTKKKKKAKRK